jgi:hypothetical protein
VRLEERSHEQIRTVVICQELYENAFDASISIDQIGMLEGVGTYIYMNY